MMRLPPETELLIRDRFERLVAKTEPLRIASEQSAQTSGPRGLPPGATRNTMVLSGSEFDSLKTNFLILLQLLVGVSRSVSMVMENVNQLTNTLSGVYALIGTIHGLKDDYENGMLIDLVNAIEANIASDYMGQAEQLLGEGIPGQFDHVPAAVLAGAVLESALRQLCQRQAPPIELTQPNGAPRTLEPLIVELQKRNVYTTAKADMLRSWAKTRNDAAHGAFDQFTKQDVETMIAGIKTFLADYL